MLKISRLTDYATAVVLFLQKDKKMHKSLCRVLKEMLCGDPSTGIGKPEPLEHNLSGLWSRRISQKDRVIYKYDKDYIYIFAIGGHYDQL